MLIAFNSRNFRLFYIGQAISLIGTSMTQVATSWLVYRLTDSAWLLGLVGFASQIPTLILIPLGGIVADRWNRQQILLVAQILGMLRSLVLGWLALSGSINVWQITFLGVLLGTINAFDIPTRQALLAAGFGFILQIITGRTLLQLLVTDENRGQITGLYVMTSTGAVPIGNLIGGALASYIGAANSVILAASVCVVGSFLFMQQVSSFRDLVRQKVHN